MQYIDDSAILKAFNRERNTIMTERERMIKALKREPITGHCPTFELEFYPTLEAIGRIHPSHQVYPTWKQMTPRERQLHLDYYADTYIGFAEKYHHSGIFVHPNHNDIDYTVRLLETVREKSGDKFFLIMMGDCTFSVPNGENMVAFSERLFDDPEGIIRDQEKTMVLRLKNAEIIAKHGGLLDGFCLSADYCFQTNPFYSPTMFSELIAPVLQKLIAGYKDMGYCTVKHSDGNIMPILDQIVQCGPDAIHSLDPQAGVSLKEVKRLYGDKVALCGNVNCGLLQTGTEEEVINDTRRALREGMEGWGYVFCTSNCVYIGLPLERYELMNKIWWEEGIYK